MPTDHSLIRWTNIFLYGTALLMLINLYNIFIAVPNEASMGIIQRIFYFHVPSAFIAFLAFGVTFVYSILFLKKRQLWYDRVAYCSAEIGVVFTTIVLLTGPIWARPVWNVWWTWDARLTSTLVLWFIYVGYMMLRSYTGEEQRGARFAAVFAIVGFVDVPIVYLANRLWRTLHPQPVIMGGADSGMSPPIRNVFLFSMVTFLGLYLLLLFYRLRIERTQLELNELKREAAYSS